MNSIEVARAQKKSEAAWKLNRTTIEELYHTNHLEGEDGLIQLMERDHDFKARYVFPPLQSTLY
jgi:hypothetical protein